jgi:hypothetical protein
MFVYAKDHKLFIMPLEEYLNAIAEDKGIPFFNPQTAKRRPNKDIIIMS